MLDRQNCLLIVPVNDEEAFLIAEIGEKIGMQVYRSSQEHGAKLEDETGIMDVLECRGERPFAHVIIVEMPGVEIEKRIKDKGRFLHIIDHHQYNDLDRAHDKDGNALPSSLHQFLELAEISDSELEQLGYDPRLVHGIGYWDAGYFWGLLDAGYSREEIDRVEEYKNELGAKIPGRLPSKEARDVAEKAWKAREAWKDFQIVVSDDPDTYIRSLVSRLSAREYWKPMPMIIVERAGKRIYVQESPRTRDLFEHFGGFTFGSDRNWGYDNEEEVRITLGRVKEFLK